MPSIFSCTAVSSQRTCEVWNPFPSAVLNPCHYSATLLIAEQRCLLLDNFFVHFMRGKVPSLHCLLAARRLWRSFHFYQILMACSTLTSYYISLGLCVFLFLIVQTHFHTALTQLAKYTCNPLDCIACMPFAVLARAEEAVWASY